MRSRKPTGHFEYVSRVVEVERLVMKEENLLLDGCRGEEEIGGEASLSNCEMREQRKLHGPPSAKPDLVACCY